MRARNEKKPRAEKDRAVYRGVRLFSRVGSPVFSGLALVFGLAAALLLVVIPIVFFVNVPPQDMVLPPYMRAVRESGALTGFDIIVGRGARFTVGADAVTLGDIKTAIYVFALLGVCVSLELSAVCSFLAKLAGGVRDHGPLDRRNADVVNYIGLTVIAGNILADIVYRWLNFTLLRTFSSEGETVRYVFGVSAAPLLLGLFILLVGFLYGYACVSAPPVPVSLPLPGEDAPPADDQPV